MKHQNGDDREIVNLGRKKPQYYKAIIFQLKN